MTLQDEKRRELWMDDRGIGTGRAHVHALLEREAEYQRKACAEDFTDETLPVGYWLVEDGDCGWRWDYPPSDTGEHGCPWPTRGMAAADARRHARIMAEYRKVTEGVDVE